MKTLICGSMAYDTIMVFGDRFKNHILPEQIHILNVAFLVPDMRREFGGCAGNIAYNLKLLGGEPLIMATIGDDSAPYMHRLKQLGLDASHVRDVPGSFTAQAFITTDLDDNQITAFHPGAMTQSHQNKVTDAKGVTLGIISPDGRDGMLQHAREFHAAKIPFIFDPGQGLPMFDGDELMAFLKLADYCTVNDYEAKLLTERTGRTLEQLANEVEALIVTLAGSGSHIYAQGRRIEIPVAPAKAVIDPTGCGDAYRAGLLFGINKGWAWEKTGRLASLMGSIKIAHRGGQNHKLTRDDIARHYQAAFGDILW
ncbi:carbohydrate kinase family protein [Sulfuritalea hydrogenivorans]|jgi:adenosine kinase|uniref:PfkB domain-containing protein n=1 Tax=Sulfuritalea hydrogenivorans sk43H TaxID=1223802 RepID=W0SI33_9PROT|nr:carbohydrate kinase family protein [Sulfuritalea hydrogenivorans]MDK9713591.1 carbohydrate kinase family protein [Sulfuritalea sp.]BAO31109.1 PfkB domain-containing protein [Sulfuritalea hydrogenivorans sk43H]